MTIDPRAPNQLDSGENASFSRRRRGRKLRVAIFLSIAITIWWLIWLAADGILPGDTLGHAILPTAVFIGVCGAAIWHERRWAAPARKLLQSIEQIRGGASPIEALGEISGPLSAVAEQTREIFHEIRRREKAVAELNAEMSQRVAGRTDALERVIGSLRQQATRDPLTGLSNRRMLDRELPTIVENCRNEGLKLTILMIDVDHFKQLNDTLGHAAGDELLRNIAQIIRSSLGEGHTAYRCGGDEFVIAMPGADSDCAAAMIARLKSLVEALTRPLKVITPPRLSIGFAYLDERNRATAEQLLEQADAMLYKMKSAGKTKRRAG